MIGTTASSASSAVTPACRLTAIGILLHSAGLEATYLKKRYTLPFVSKPYEGTCKDGQGRELLVPPIPLLQHLQLPKAQIALCSPLRK
jgi:hypothetical protein